jgi:hypothetical protein
MTGVNPDAEYSFKNALYAGLVGFASGAVSAGSGTVATFANNQARGKKIIESGNSQTLVNTATYVADKLAGAGVDFKNASDWVQMLRGQVNAYEKLSPDARAGTKGQTILGEMQTALAFAEAQSAFAGVQEKIQTADEAKRADMAAYVSEVVGKEYTAQDIADNKDNIAWQLAIMDFASGLADIDGAIAQEEFVETNLAQQQGAADINMGRGAIVIGLAAIIVGEAMCPKLVTNFAIRLLCVVGGAIIYWVVFQTVVFLGLPSELLKMLSALVVALFLGVPYLKKVYFSTKKKAEVKKNA